MGASDRTPGLVRRALNGIRSATVDPMDEGATGPKVTPELPSNDDRLVLAVIAVAVLLAILVVVAISALIVYIAR